MTFQRARGFASISAQSASLTLLEKKAPGAASKIFAPEGRQKRAMDDLPTAILPEDYGPPHDVRVQKLPQVYMEQCKLADVQEEDVGKWYLCREQDIGRLPLCLSIAHKMLFEATLSEHMMIRQPTFDLIQVLNEIKAEDTQDSANGKSVGVHGPRGTGKSLTLNLVAQYALQNDWLLIACRGEDLVRDLLGFISPSEQKPGIFEQNRYAREWCRYMLESQGNKLKRIKLKNKYDYTWKSPETGTDALGLECEEEGVTLHDLATQATINVETAASVVYDIVKELELVEPEEMKVMVVMDNVNVWDQNSRFRFPDSPHKSIPARQLSMVDAFSRFMLPKPLGSGLSVWAITAGGHATLTQSQGHLAATDFAIGTSIYDDDEFVSSLSHCKTSKLIQSDVDPFFIARVKGLTGNVPRDVLFDACLT